VNGKKSLSRNREMQRNKRNALVEPVGKKPAAGT